MPERAFFRSKHERHAGVTRCIFRRRTAGWRIPRRTKKYRDANLTVALSSIVNRNGCFVSDDEPFAMGMCFLAKPSACLVNGSGCLGIASGRLDIRNRRLDIETGCLDIQNACLDIENLCFHIENFCFDIDNGSFDIEKLSMWKLRFSMSKSRCQMSKHPSSMLKQPVSMSKQDFQCRGEILSIARRSLSPKEDSRSIARSAPELTISHRLSHHLHSSTVNH